MSDNKKFHEEFINKIIKTIEAGTAPWQKPWKAEEMRLPINHSTQKEYSGVNIMSLLANGYNDNRFLTFNQIQKIQEEDFKPLRVRKGEKGHKVVFYEFNTKTPVLDKEGKPTFGEDGNCIMQESKRDYPVTKFFTVFNGTQIDNMPELEKREITWNPVERAEKLLENSQARIIHDQADRAFYSPTNDCIHMPHQSQFESAEKYYSTLMHELSHWTAQEDRVSRGEEGDNKADNYALEELRAEIGAWLVCAELGLPFEPEQAVSYIQSWSQAIKNDPFAIEKACRDANKIKDYIISCENTFELTQDLEVEEKQQEEKKSLFERASSFSNQIVGKIKDEIEYYAQDLDEIFFQEDNEIEYYPQDLDDNFYQTANEYHERIEESPYIVNETQQEQETAKRGEILDTEKSKNQDKTDETFSKKESETQKTTQENQENVHETQPSKEIKEIAAQDTKLFVDFQEREKAKKLGAKWNGQEKTWYAPAGTDLSLFKEWRTPQEKKQVITPLSAEAEFAQTLRKAGFILDGLPIMDGKAHRVPVEKNGKKNLDGTYTAYSDGIPAGFYQNFYTGEASKWKYSAQEFSQEQKEAFKAQVQQNKLETEKIRKQEQELASKRAYAIWKNAPSWANEEHSYLAKKQVKSYGIKVDDKGNLLIPIRNKENFIQSLQFITTDGNKMLQKNGKLSAGFHTIDPNKQLGQKPIMLAEGYATAASLYELTGMPTVCCFSANNIKAVVEALREKFPKQEIYIMADNDHKNQVNIGIEKAQATAQAVKNVKVFVPHFNEKEKAQGLSDFNDLICSQGKERALNQLKEQNKAYKRAQNNLAHAI